MQISTALSRAIVAFAATNLDDIFVLTFFFAQKNLQIWRVVLGQYLGIAGLILVSLVGFFASLLIPYKWIGLLGLIPIGIGIRKLLALKEGQKEKIVVRRVESSLTVAAITFANGGDNIAIYTPLFASSTWATLTITLITFSVMIALWCVAGYAIGNHFVVIRLIDRYGHILVPFIFIGLGFYILLGSQSRL
ncbi:MAG TPA: cadmium resistance transporter [Pyrinomonadaceae bacterium]|jgi:cadmium resistance protein CadD (predicted permease)|nr:cadmium resistance transporter [Pyrinomonadaceae bacterium]